jgi:hypothetical protein
MSRQLSCNSFAKIQCNAFDLVLRVDESLSVVSPETVRTP